MEEIRSDDQVLKAVTEAIAWDSRINDDSLNIVVHEGRVLLSGQVATYAEKVIASEDAWRVKGVRQIENNIVVIPGELRSDREIAADLEALLRADTRANREDVKVSVSGGIVYLEGAVRNYHQKLAAAEDAWFTSGVVDVVNGLEVRSDHKRTDAEIIQDVREALNRDATIVDPPAIEVTCRGGVVTLRGPVQSPEESRIAEDEARFVAGVDKVINNLTVQPATFEPPSAYAK